MWLHLMFFCLLNIKLFLKYIFLCGIMYLRLFLFEFSSMIWIYVVLIWLNYLGEDFQFKEIGTDTKIQVFILVMISFPWRKGMEIKVLRAPRNWTNQYNIILKHLINKGVQLIIIIICYHDPTNFPGYINRYSEYIWSLYHGYHFSK